VFTEREGEIMLFTQFGRVRIVGIHTFALLAGALMLAAGAYAGTGNEAHAATTSFSVEMIGANEVPPASSAGSGTAMFTFDDQSKALTFSVTMKGLPKDQVTASHIHRAAPGVAGPAVHTLASAAFETVSGTVTLSDADIADLKAGNLYVNIHSVANPSGFARGQLVLPSVGAPSTGTGPAGVAGGGPMWALVIGGAALLVVSVVAGAASRGTSRA